MRGSTDLGRHLFVAPVEEMGSSRDGETSHPCLVRESIDISASNLRNAQYLPASEFWAGSQHGKRCSLAPSCFSLAWLWWECSLRTSPAIFLPWNFGNAQTLVVLAWRAILFCSRELLSCAGSAGPTHQHPWLRHSAVITALFLRPCCEHWYIR